MMALSVTFLSFSFTFSFTFSFFFFSVFQEVDEFP